MKPKRANFLCGIRLGFFLGILAFGGGAFRSIAAVEPTEPADHDVYRLLLLAPNHPVFIELHVQIDGQGLIAVRTAYAEQLVKNYDKNGDSLLDREEAKLVPPLVKSPTVRDSIVIADRWEAVDVDPADDQVSAAELAAYIDRMFGRPFEISMKPLSAAQGVDLLSLLDQNGDGRLSHEEMSSAVRILQRYDFDEDETLTIDELQGSASGSNTRAAVTPSGPANAEQPFLNLDDSAQLPEIAKQLIQRYGSAEGEGGAINLRALGLESLFVKDFKNDGDDVWKAEELTAFLKSPKSHLVLNVQLPKAKAGRPKISVVSDPYKTVAVAGNSKQGSDKLAFTIGGVSVQFHALTTRSTLADSRALIKTTKFKTADADKNGYLSESEFGGLGLPDADFKSVDRNSDEMVTLEEILAYIDQEAASSQSRVEFVVSHDGKSVFQVVDANNDRRITRRELVHAYERLIKFDQNGDDEIAAVELAGRFKADMSLGRPVLLRNTVMANRGGDMTAPIISALTNGPEWFRKMDRNRDGDVSPREFLGPPALFKRLDLDGDGLITADEANQAEKLVESLSSP